MRCLLFLALPLMLSSACAAAADRPRSTFAADMRGFIAGLRQSPAAPPGSAVIVVHRGTTIFESASGVRNLSTGAPMTMDTPTYHASVTKTYTALLAAMLDAERKLPLDASLPDIWPGQTLPPPLDPRAVTISRLLSHSSGVREGGMVFRSVWTGEISARTFQRCWRNTPGRARRASHTTISGRSSGRRWQRKSPGEPGTSSSRIAS
jgi:CubicO group peptidase (beta-lactamase class C family)